jgi:hypothetical protein
MGVSNDGGKGGVANDGRKGDLVYQPTNGDATKGAINQVEGPTTTIVSNQAMGIDLTSMHNL